MARDDRIDAQLRQWAQWLMVGDGSGYPARCTLHPEWSPPAPGSRPTLKTKAPSSARRVHAAIGRLPDRLQHTLWVHYCASLSLDDQAARLECQPCTVSARVLLAHRLLAGVLHNMES